MATIETGYRDDDGVWVPLVLEVDDFGHLVTCTTPEGDEVDLPHSLTYLVS